MTRHVISLGTLESSAVATQRPNDLRNARYAISGPYSSINIMVKTAELSTYYNPMDLAAFCGLLTPDGTISIILVDGANASPADFKPIHTSFLLAGLAGISEQVNVIGNRIFTAKRRNITVTAAPLQKVGLDTDDLIDEDGLLIESSNLLTPPPMQSKASKSADDCGGRAPCDNCSCGRADAQQNKDPNTTSINAPKSSCGSCGLGDAFRCPSCPYLGKPAFKPGEEHLVLDLQDDI